MSPASSIALAQRILTGAGHREAAYENGRMKYGGFSLTRTGVPGILKLQYLSYSHPHYQQTHTDTRKAASVLAHLGNYTLLLLPHFNISLVSSEHARYLLLQQPTEAEKQNATAAQILVALTDAGYPLHTEDPFTEGFDAEPGTDPSTIRLSYIVPASDTDRAAKKATAYMNARITLQQHGYETHESTEGAGHCLFVWDGFNDPS